MPTWYGTNTINSVYQELNETSPGADATSSPNVGWTPGTTSATGTPTSPLDSGAMQAAASFSGTTHPDASLNATTGDAFRTATTYSGSFASANWTWTGRVVGTVSRTQGGRFRLRLLRSVNADGSAATQITAAQQTAGASTTVSTTAANNAVTFNPGAFTLTNEYLFMELAWQIDVAGSMTDANVIFQFGTTTTLVSSTFTPADKSLVVPSTHQIKSILMRR